VNETLHHWGFKVLHTQSVSASPGSTYGTPTLAPSDIKKRHKGAQDLSQGMVPAQFAGELRC